MSIVRDLIADLENSAAREGAELSNEIGQLALVALRLNSIQHQCEAALPVGGISEDFRSAMPRLLGIIRYLEDRATHLASSVMYSDEWCIKAIGLEDAVLEELKDRIKKRDETISDQQDQITNERREANQARFEVIELRRKLSLRNGEDSPNDPDVRKAVLDLTDGKCAYCGVDVADANNGMHVEHVVPASEGGPNKLANYVPACPSCNTSKGTAHVVTFIRRRMGRLEVSCAPTLQVIETAAEFVEAAE